MAALSPEVGLKASLREGRPRSVEGGLPASPAFEYGARRLLLAWAQAGCFGSDQAVLLRQAVRWHPESKMYVNKVHESISRHLAKAGMILRPDGFLEALPYTKKEMKGCDNAPTLRGLDESMSAEPYLRSVGYGSWKSLAQKEAAWAVLNTLPGKTRLVVLPTGGGKSLCFQLLPRFVSGLTVVVVPTIALAIDQQTSAARQLQGLPGVNPLYFASDDDPERTARLVKDRQTRLLFSSPEACVSGRLRRILDELASSGWLQNLVIDEAHLIETWGAHFRVEFQVLAAVRRKWHAASKRQMRTYLFSATMTPLCRELLNGMFSDDAPADEFVSQRVRPEIQYYSCTFRDETERNRAAVEAIWHLPRPAIVYVTERQEAERFAEALRNEGFSRLGCFHGDTRAADRRTLLRDWKENRIDLMVATSAFGVGVDKPDVRAVLHACFPENLDRYYQEVGRGGRDGWSSVSLLMPTPHDRKVAEGITVRLMRPEMVQTRWEAMLRNAEQRDDYVYALPMDSRHTELVGTRTYSENVRWNKRLLLQLQRAGKLELLDIEQRAPREPDGEREEWAIARVGFTATTPKLADLIARERDDEVKRFSQGLDLLTGFAEARRCAAKHFAKLYGMLEDDQRACAGCPWCRENEREPSDCKALGYPHVKGPTSKDPPDVVENFPSPLRAGERNDFVHYISLIVNRPQTLFRHFVAPERDYEAVLSCFSEAFPENDPALFRVDAMGGGWGLSSAATPRLLFLHVGELNQRAFVVGLGMRSVHLLCAVANQHDQSGRHISANVEARRWNSLESWLKGSHEL